MQLNNDDVRNILLRLVSKNNTSLSSLFASAYSGQKQGYSKAFSGLLNVFVCQSKNGYSDAVNYVLKLREGTPYYAFNFFDIDTLYAYNTFLEEIINTLDAIKKEQRLTPKIVDDILAEIGKNLRKNAGKKESGYYNVREPIRYAYVNTGKDNVRVHDPRKKLKWEEFINYYGKAPEDFKDDIDSYIASRHKERGMQVEASPNEGVEESLEDASVQEELVSIPQEPIRYMYNGKALTLQVDSVKYYVDENGAGVTYYKASCEDGYLFTARRSASGRVYIGPMYSRDGRWIADSEGDVFYPNVRYMDALRERNHTTNNATQKPIVVVANTSKKPRKECKGQEYLQGFGIDD